MTLPSLADAPFHCPPDAPDPRIGNKSAAKWVPAHDAALTLHLGNFLTFDEAASAINREFGTTYSRNAALGRAMRIGLRSHNAPEPRTGFPQKPRARPEPAPRPVRARVIPPAEVIAFRCEEIVPLHVTLMDLQPNGCRYPYGDGPFTFCGHPWLIGASYCVDHFDLCNGRRV